MMAAAGILGEYKGSQAREVVMTLKEYERIRQRMQADAEAEYEGESHLAEDEEDSSEADYVTEGQQGYISVDSDG